MTSKASIRRLKPLLGRAQGTTTWVVLAQVPQRTRGTLAWIQVTPVALGVSWTGGCSAPHWGQEHRVPGAKARWKSIRPDWGSKATSTTSQGAGRPSARVNNDNGSMMKTADVLAWRRVRAYRRKEGHRVGLERATLRDG